MEPTGMNWRAPCGRRRAGGTCAYRL